MDLIRREYKKDDKNLLAIAKQHSDKVAINFDGIYYSIACWKTLDNIVRVQFKEVPRAKLRIDNCGKRYFS